MDSTALQELLADGINVSSRASSNHLHHTWAKTFFAHPELYIKPRSVEEVQNVVRLARRYDRHLVTVGSGHSYSDLTCTADWMMNLDELKEILHVDRQNRLVTVQAGIRLRDLGKQLEEHGLTLTNIGSIDDPSLAGALATGTHGGSLQHGLISDSVDSLRLVRADGELVNCSTDSNVALFRAALVSLGAVGVTVEVTLKADHAVNVKWRESRQPLSTVLANWPRLWESHEFVRVNLLPYTQSAIVLTADATDQPVQRPPTSFAGKISAYIQGMMLAMSNKLPRILPWMEWFVSGVQYGFGARTKVKEGVSLARECFLMDFPYSQLADEWALPLELGPEAIVRLSAWLNGDQNVAQIPVSCKNIWINSPIEIRAVDTRGNERSRPFLDPSCRKGPTLYMNATLCRPFLQDPYSRAGYYEAFEFLMGQLHGRPHWAKNFSTVGASELHQSYGGDMDQWVRIQREVDPKGMFLNAWHHRNLPVSSAPI